MAASVAHKDRSRRGLARREATRAAKKVVVIVTEGSKTEPEYFRALAKNADVTLLDLRIVGGAGVPLSIAVAALDEKAKLTAERTKNSFAENDEIWAVFDRDEHPNFEEACRRCRENGIGLAYSIPCFEYWLILHFEDFGRQDNHRQVQKYLTQIWPDYDHASRKSGNIAHVVETVHVAENRAEGQLARLQAAGAVYGRPSSTVFQLTRILR